MGKPKFIYWRSLRKHPCPHCEARLWFGYDDDVMAWRAIVDAGVFLNHKGEQRAIIKGRETWRYEPGPPARIWLRDRWHRKGCRAGEIRHGRPLLVVVEHVCGRPVPEWARFYPQTPDEVPVDSDSPPF